MRSKKGQGLSVGFIILIVLGLVIVVIMIYMIGSRVKMFGASTGSCVEKQGSCIEAGACKGAIIGKMKDCGENQVCCVTYEEEGTT